MTREEINKNISDQTDITFLQIKKEKAALSRAKTKQEKEIIQARLDKLEAEWWNKTRPCFDELKTIISERQ